MSGMEVTEGQLLSQDLGVGGPPAAVKLRPLAVIEAELEMLKQDTRQKETALLCNYIEFGRRLEEAKAQLRHGEWGGWLKKMEVSQSTANNLMRIFREYGAEQQSLFGGAAKSQTFGHLTYSKAVLLLMVPEEERERFAVENDVEHMSSRELKAAIKARDEAQEKAAAAEDAIRRLNQETEQLREEMADQAHTYKAKLTAADVETTEANRKAREAQEALEKQRKKAQRLQDALSQANTAAQATEEEYARLAKELEDLRSRPAEADTAAVEAARQSAIAEMSEKVDEAREKARQDEEKRRAAEESLEAAQKELADLKAREPQMRELTQEEKDALTAGAVEQARAEAAEQVRELEKKLASADPNVAELKVRFKSWQKEYWGMMEVFDPIARTDEERGGKLRQPIEDALEQMLNYIRRPA